ncbi:MAG: SDR family NAD(P)-dependent oxidoreductase [Sediminimonas qiaohouensis]|uniref:SDR family NAD(P)-dependent oxidoreductase n=1 Tax=Sediminimonas qiaohouensis TaxID=552061 RepID=A0A7C9LBA1_9RHOB|nr:SDR family NAD(P)-dependent oxidoreductase [Sediminimonas qiaohouensis]MTJ04977.1 SDR family NAD(P)-dependent oxidoreductase [Sediminimonas qiaohouensis]
MIDWREQRYWLIGASEGLGAALAGHLSRAGAHVILSARNTGKLHELAGALPGPTTVQPMDVRDDQDVAEAVRAVGPVDGVVYLAGVYTPMTAGKWEVDAGAAMTDVNLTGAMRVLGRVVPEMAARGAGHIVLTGSLAGFRGLPGAVGYGASKAGIMSLAETLRADLHRTPVQVQLANPGFIRTRLTDKNDFHMPFLMEPDHAAREVFELMCTPNRFARSFPTLFSLLFRMSRFLPDSVYFRLFA